MSSSKLADKALYDLHEERQNLERFFESMFMRFLAFLHEHDVLDETSARVVYVVLRLPLETQMSFMAELEAYMITKEDQKDPAKILDACQQIMDYMTSAQADLQSSIAQQKSQYVLQQLGALSNDQLLSVYRYMECCHRTAKTHQQLLKSACLSMNQNQKF